MAIERDMTSGRRSASSGAQSADLEWFAALRETMSVTQVDGVPVLHSHAAGPVQAGLMFRVGAADEELPQRGLTHLVEHLALHGQLTPSEHRNGMTGSTLTQFVVSGSEQQAVAFLNHVCEALRNLPLDRLEAERAILRVEAQHRQGSADARVQEIRYGAEGLARPSFVEFAIDAATPDQVQAWARTWFTSGNAIAWVTTEHVPSGLDLRLPEGPRRSYRAASRLLTEYPVWEEGTPGLALIDGVVNRTSAAVLFADVLSKALFRRLRLERGLSYTAAAHYEPIDSERARILVHADCAPDSSAELVHGLAEVLEAASSGRFWRPDIEESREQARENTRRMGLSPEAVLPGAAMGYLLGGEPWHPAVLAADREAVTEADLAAVAAEFWGSSIWLTPVQPAPEVGVSAFVTSPAAAVSGTSFLHKNGTERLIFGEEGVSVVGGNGIFTVLYADCVLALRYPDGGRLILGRDATSITVEPNLLSLFDAEALAAVDAAVPPAAVVHLPARSAEQFPHAAKPVKKPGLGTGGLVTAALLLVVAIPLVVLFVATLASIGQLDASGEPITIATARWYGVAGALTVGSAIAVFRQWLRRRAWDRSQANS